VVVELHALGVDKALAALAQILKNLVHRIYPAVAAVFVNFVRPEDAALAPIGQKAPRVAVAGTCRVRLPRALELFAPAGLKLLVEVDAAANIGVLWDELQRFAARDIEAPRRNNLLLDVRAAGSEFFDRIVR